MDMGNVAAWVAIGVTLFIAGSNAMILVIIKFNDLHHLTKDLGELKAALEKLVGKVENLAERVAKIEGSCEVSHVKPSKKR